jgi:hypothetical protein
MGAIKYLKRHSHIVPVTVLRGLVVAVKDVAVILTLGERLAVVGALFFDFAVIVKV